MKKSNIYKGFLDFQFEFDHRYACWAYNHRGWAKMKKSNKRLAKKRERNNWKKEAKEYERKSQFGSTDNRKLRANLPCTWG